MQSKFHYEYGQYKNAHPQAKKLRNRGEFVWMVTNPKTGKLALICGESMADKPTRVPVMHEYVPTLPRTTGWADLSDGALWRTLVRLVDAGQITIAIENEGAVSSGELIAALEQEIYHHD